MTRQVKKLSVFFVVVSLLCIVMKSIELGSIVKGLIAYALVLVIGAILVPLVLWVFKD